jgi:prefoldin subunit 5
MASTDELRDDVIAQQCAKLAQSKAAFTTAIKEILDAMDHPDDPESIIDVIAHSFAKAHLREAMEAALAVVEMSRPMQRSPSSIFP